MTPLPLPLHAGLIAVGGAGCAALAAITDAIHTPLATLAINTDPEGLAACPAERKLLLGADQPLAGQAAVRAAAKAQLPAIQAWASGMDVLFLVGGLGGTAGSTLLPLLAEQVSCRRGPVPIVFTPFPFEGPERLAASDAALASLQQTPQVRALFELQGDAQNEEAQSLSLEEYLAQRHRQAGQFCRLLVQGLDDAPSALPPEDWRHLLDRCGPSLIHTRGTDGDTRLAATRAPDYCVSELAALV